ncbi:MAG TPA: tail fiber domain-containing protein, partial [Chthoniobacterales bacterium]|nr:tail fiber domain-containing protein [Chthoniobacterales bacterium]
TAFRLTTLLSLFALTGVALLPMAHAVSPPPDGGYDNFNTAEGTDALLNLSTGAYNTAVGYIALQNNAFGNFNTATGAYALSLNNFGSGNTAHGYNALGANTTGLANTAQGKDALAANTTGSVNTASGDVALSSNTFGSANTASGANALAGNTTGSSNTADGYGALFANATGGANTASGYNALLNNSTGSNNIALGYLAGSNLTTGDNNIEIGNTGTTRESAKIRIGTRGTHNDTYIAGIFGATVASGAAVFVDNKGHLGTITSSARYKEEIKPMAKASEAILGLEPVTFHYKKEIDPQSAPQFGLVAEQVARVDPDLVARDENGRPYTVRYEAVNAMLLNEFLKQHRRMESLETTVAELKSALQKQAAQMETEKETRVTSKQ